jgi:hypothetical protein
VSLKLFYIALIIEWIPLVLCIVLPRIFGNKIKTSLLFWFATKCIADLASIITLKILKLNFFPIFHISVLIENLIMFVYIFNFFNFSKTKRLLLYSIPILIFVFEILFFGSLFELNKISLVTCNLLVSILLLILLFAPKKIEKREFSFILTLFVFHSISFVYFLFDQFRRYNEYINENIYPIYIVFVVFLNLHFLYFIWSKRRK